MGSLCVAIIVVVLILISVRATKPWFWGLFLTMEISCPLPGGAAIGKKTCLASNFADWIDMRASFVPSGLTAIAGSS